MVCDCQEGQGQTVKNSKTPSGRRLKRATEAILLLLRANVRVLVCVCERGGVVSENAFTCTQFLRWDSIISNKGRLKNGSRMAVRMGEESLFHSVM